jgi:hypothetical protein
VKDRGNAGDRRCWRSKQGGCVESAGVCGHFAGGVGARGGGDDGNARRRALSHIALTEQLRQFTAREVARAGVQGSRKREVTIALVGKGRVKGRDCCGW